MLRAVMLIVSKEHDQGLRVREDRQLRGSGILAMSFRGASRGCFFRKAPGGLSVDGGPAPLEGISVRAIALSNFLLSSVLGCVVTLVTSCWAEVELHFCSCLLLGLALGGRPDWMKGSRLSVSSAEPDNLLIIEPNSR